MMPSKPLAKGAVRTAVARNFPKSAEKYQPSRVLVVDDEALMRWSVAETLGEQGWQVTEAVDGVSAMDAFPEIAHAKGVVFLDLWLPDSNDLQLLAAMHGQSPGTPVILMTAHGTPDLVDEARALGAFAVIDKPFDLNDLIPLVNAASMKAGSMPPSKTVQTPRTSI
jgi:DNA-binding NtrC family response regulator